MANNAVKKNEWKKNENGVSRRGEIPTNWPKQVKENQTNSEILLANVFHIYYLFWTKLNSQNQGNFMSLTWNFYSDIHRSVSPYLFPKHQNWGNFWVFLCFSPWYSHITSLLRSVRGTTCPHGYPSLLQTLSKKI